MRSCFILAAFFLAASIGHGQEKQGSHRDRGLDEGVYLRVGAATGPDFEDFFNYVNETYGEAFLNTSDRIDKFGSAAVVSAGYMYRFHPYFALDVGFSIYQLKSRGEIRNLNPARQETSLQHDLEYQVGVFSFTVPVLLEFSRRQPVVPFVGVGVSIFAMRLDDYRDDGLFQDIYRDTDTAVGGHFEAGAYIKPFRSIWFDLRGRWHKGSGHLRAVEPGGFLSEFKIDQDFSIISAGVVYFFR
jgi:hypothetical protein